MFECSLPPQDIEVEDSLIASCFIFPDLSSEIIELVSPEVFYKTTNRQIFKAIVDVARDGNDTDISTVLAKLNGNNVLGSNLQRFLDVPASHNIEHHARRLREKYVLRRAIEVANAIMKRCYDPGSDAESVIDYAQKNINGLEPNSGKCQALSVNDLIATVIDDIEERSKTKGRISGIPTGFNRLDHITGGLQRSDLILLGARPSMGKTALAMQIAVNASRAGFPVVVFSLEMSGAQLMMRQICSESKVDSQRVRIGALSRDEWVRITDAAGAISKMPVFVDDRGGLHYMEILRAARKLNKESGVQLVVIDYLQLASGDKDQNREQEVSSISRALKSLAKELNIPVLVLSQLNRKLEERREKRPQLSDLRDSGSLEQDADVVMFLYRDELYSKDAEKGVAEVNILKHRNGPIDTAKLAWLPTFTRFENMSPDY